MTIDTATLSEMSAYRGLLESKTPGLRLSLSSVARALVRRALRDEERSRQAEAPTS